MSDSPEPAVPAFFHLLSPEDQKGYHELREKVGSPDNRYNRNKRLESLQRLFDEIKAFCIRNDEHDSARCLVCGLTWLPDGDIAINIRHLHILLNKSKSTINGALVKMNYVQVPTKGEDADRLVAALPQLRGHYYDQREWTIRRRVSKDVPVPTQPTVFTPPDSYPGDRYFETRRDEDDPWDIFPGPSYFPTGDGFFFTSLQFAPTKLPPQLVQSSADCAGPWSKMFAPESCFVECCRRKKAFIKGLDMSIEKVIDSALAFQRFWWWASRMDELLTFLRDFARTAARRLDFGAPSKGIGGLEAAPFLF